MIISLIQALYNSKVPLPSEPGFYEHVMKDIEFFSISPQIYNLLKQHGLLQNTPSFFQDCLKKDYNITLYKNILIKNQTIQILKQFEGMKIPVIPLKGVLFSEKYFGHIGARSTSDIDVLIKKGDLEKAINCVKSLGYTLEGEPIPSHFHSSFSKKLPGSPIPLTIELHWNLLKDKTSTFKIEEFWNAAQPFNQYKYVKGLSDYHTFYMICLHGWKHNLNSLRYFLDIIQLIYVLNSRLDYSTLWNDARSHQTLKRLTRTLAIVHSQFPHLNHVKPFPVKKGTPLWWEYQAIRDNNYKSFKQYLNFFQFQFFDFDSCWHSLRAIFNWLLPSKYELYSELESTHKDYPVIVEYLRLYKKRFYNFFHRILFYKLLEKSRS